MRRRRILMVAVVMSALAGSALYLATGRAQPPQRSAVFVAPDGSDDKACTREAPCLSFDRAYSVARPGAEVEVAAGTYGPQAVRPDPAKNGSADVVFRPAPGAAVTVGEVEVYASNLEFRDMRFAGGWLAQACSANLTFRNLQSKHIYITSASNVRVVGGSVGPGVDYDPQIAAAPSGPCAGEPPRKILIDGVDFHDWTRTGDQHVECLQIGAGVNVIIRNSRFRRCATHDIFIRSWGGTSLLRGFTIENNFLDDSIEGYTSLRISEQAGIVCEDFLVRNNSALDDMLMDCAASNARFVSNIQPTMNGVLCGYNAGVEWDYNLYRFGTPCGPNDRVGEPRFRDSANLDLHLLAGSAAIDAGHPTEHPAMDIDGDGRPAGAAGDVGADEAG